LNDKNFGCLSRLSGFYGFSKINKLRVIKKPLDFDPPASAIISACDSADSIPWGSESQDNGAFVCKTAH